MRKIAIIHRRNGHVLHPLHKDTAFSEADVQDLRNILLSGAARSRPAFYKDDWHWSFVGRVAARILARHGHTAILDPRTGKVSFS